MRSVFLSDKEIREALSSGSLSISPLDPDQVRENGVDLTIGDEVCWPISGKIVDPLSDSDVSDLYKCTKIGSSGFVVHPGSSVLTHTREYVEFPTDMVGLVFIKSTLARLGMYVPPTAVDAGFAGQIVIELISTQHYVRIKPGMSFIHLLLARTGRDAEKPYWVKGRYMKQKGVRFAKLPLKRYG